INIGEPVEASFELVIANEEVTLRRSSGDEEADVEFICDGETYVMVMYGRITPDEAIVSGDLDWEGDERLALGFGARFLGG
ncbi:MAG: SCP2 sterol-binding domain-containing protein, partial [Chloroflexota bacterium]|nr:SCP2 sterol-binding domain-containing protein [Chloroflexota bacterium]